jgi:uncharacterized protein YndB with AHSA1/START domain
MAATNGLMLELTRTLPAPRPEVWSAMTDHERLAAWWGPKGFTVPSVDFEPRVGGRYRIAMQPPEGDLFYLHGEFHEVDPPSRLVYTFVWEPPAPDDRETLVTLVLEDRGEQTAVSLQHGEFATEERLELHQGGWTDSFEKLEGLLG